MITSLLLTLIGAKSVGWCLNDKQMDQDEGSRVLPGRFESSQCLKTCQDIKEKSILYEIRITGCEHNSYSYSCQYHTKPVSGGSGSKGYTCWTFEAGQYKISNT